MTTREKQILQLLAVSAPHADGTTWPMTGRIYFFSSADLKTPAPSAAVRAIPGNARDMHLGTFLSAGEGKWGDWLAAGAPTALDNTGVVHLYYFNPSEAVASYGIRGKGSH